MRTVKVRPTYPGIERQILGILLTIFVLVAYEAATSRFGPIRQQGLFIILAVGFSAYWSGLRAGIISSAIVIAYIFIIFTYPSVSSLKPKPENKSREIISSSIFFPGLAFVIGTVTGKLRKSRIREFDAQEAAEAEAVRRVRTEDTLRSSEEMQRLVVDSAMDAVIAVDATGAITLWNPVAEAMFGWTSEEAIGLKINDLIVPEHFKEAHVNGLAHFLKTGEGPILGKRLELQAVAKNKRVFDAELSVVAHQTGEGHTFIGFLRDISDRKKAEESIRNLNEDLERRVALRTAELDSALRNVEKQKHLAYEASRLKSEFLSSMSHELRTPLNGIIGFSEFLADEKPGALNEKQKEYLGDILNSGRHLLQLINSVLDLAKVESGKMDLVPEEFRLERAISEVVSVVSPIAIRKEIEVNIHIDPNFPKVMLDQSKTKQILYNLLSNAVKFTEEGGRVDIRATLVDSNSFKIVVEDTGIGIKPEDMDRLFVEFQQLESGAGRRFQGTGLGLTLTKKIVELQGGTVDVTSELGKGSIFSVVLPLHVLEDA